MGWIAQQKSCSKPSRIGSSCSFERELTVRSATDDEPGARWILASDHVPRERILEVVLAAGGVGENAVDVDDDRRAGLDGPARHVQCCPMVRASSPGS